MTTKPLILYYSLQGNTKFVAEALAEALNGELVRLTTDDEPRGKSTFGGILWFVWQRIRGKMPTLDPLRVNLQDYDKIVLGSPVWGSGHALLLETFFNQYQLLNKQIALFCTCQGDAEQALDGMAERLVGNEIVGRKGFVKPLENEAEARQAAQEWATGLFSA